MKTGLYRDKNAVIKKKKDQIPLPTDRALNDADKACIATKILLYKKDKMMVYPSLPPHTQCVLSFIYI